jgi:hypothetical protein
MIATESGIANSSSESLYGLSRRIPQESPGPIELLLNPKLTARIWRTGPPEDKIQVLWSYPEMTPQAVSLNRLSADWQALIRSSLAEAQYHLRRLRELLDLLPNDEKERVEKDDLRHWLEVAEAVDDLLLRFPCLQAERPYALPQHTFPEARTFFQALSDGPTLRWWTKAESGGIMIHAIPDWPLQTKFDPSILPDIWGRQRPQTSLEMQAWLQKAGPDAVLIVQMALGCALTRPKRPIEIDWLVNSVFDPRSRAERNEYRVWVWDILRVAATMAPYGTRYGKWRDKYSRRDLDVYIQDPLLRLGPEIKPVQPALFPDDVPIAVGFDGGYWLERFRGNEQVLSYFGNILQIAKIPGRKVAGAWARVIALNLNQWWRDQSKTANPRTHSRIGPDGLERKVVTAQYRPKDSKVLTRRKLLLGVYRPGPRHDLEAILKSDRPGRAKNYWKDAVRTLKRSGFVVYYRECKPLEVARKGWQAEWLDQPLDIRPCKTGTEHSLAIAEAKRHRRH